MTKAIDDEECVSYSDRREWRKYVAKVDAEITRFRTALSEAEEREKRMRDGLNVIATSWFKDDQHQTYAKHVLASAALEGAT